MSSKTDKSRDLRPPRVPEERPGPAGGKRDANRKKRIAQICDAALGLFLDEGVTRVTIDQIVDRAGVAKGSFYRYFKDKVELVETLFEPFGGTFSDAIDECERALDVATSPAELSAAYFGIAQAVASLIVANPLLTRLYLQESRGPAVGAREPIRRLAERIADRATALSDNARTHGLLRDLDPRVGTLIVIGATERLIFEQLSRGDLGKPDEVSHMLISVILDGVRQR